LQYDDDAYTIPIKKMYTHTISTVGGKVMKSALIPLLLINILGVAVITGVSLFSKMSKGSAQESRKPNA